MKKILLILLIAAVLRFVLLDRVPPSLNWDEVSHGYNAYSILKTGRDEWGFSLPLIFRAFGDFKLPVYIYATVLPVAVFGLNAFAVRFSSALAGTLAVLGIYLLTKEITRNRHTALLSAFLLALCPWHFFISRPALEANLALTLIIFGFYFLIKALKSQAKFYFISAIFLSLSLHTYNTARIFVPLLLMITVLIYRKKIRLGPALIISAMVSTLALGLVVFEVKTGEGLARYQKLEILSPDRVFQIGQMRQNSKLPKPLPQLLYNRPVYFAEVFTKNYISYFSPQFFTQSKGAQSQFAIPGENLLGVPVILLAIIGIYISRSPFLLAWLLASPVAAAATYDPPQALRPNPLIIPIIIFAAITLNEIAKFKDKKLYYLSLALPVVAMMMYQSHYFGSYVTQYSNSWQYGYEQVMDLVKAYPDKTIIITKRYGEPHIFYAFYEKLDPKILQDKSRSLRFKQSDWYWTDRIDNVYFVNDWDIPTTHTEKIHLESGGSVPTAGAILVTSPDHVPQNTATIKVINFLDGTPAFVVAKF